MNVPHGEGKDHQWVLPGLSKVESVESGMLLSGAEKYVVDVEANDKLPSDVVNMPVKSDYWSCLADTVLLREFKHGGESEQEVGIGPEL